MSELQGIIDTCGGLYTQAGLARRWKVSKAYVSEVVARDDFPTPTTFIDGDKPVWYGNLADDWRATPRRKGPKT